MDTLKLLPLTDEQKARLADIEAGLIALKAAENVSNLANTRPTRWVRTPRI